MVKQSASGNGPSRTHSATVKPKKLQNSTFVGGWKKKKKSRVLTTPCKGSEYCSRWPHWLHEAEESSQHLCHCLAKKKKKGRNFYTIKPNPLLRSATTVHNPFCISLQSPFNL